jgi:hypothetical protein
MGGLVYEEHHDDGMGDNIGTGIKDPLKDLVYRVHPLPEAMVDHVFDFGSLAPGSQSRSGRDKSIHTGTTKHVIQHTPNWPTHSKP